MTITGDDVRAGLPRGDGARLDRMHHYDIAELRRRCTDYILRNAEGRDYSAKTPLANADAIREAVAGVLAAIDRLDEVVYGSEAEQRARALRVPPMFDLKTAAGAAGEGGRIRAHGKGAPTDHHQFYAEHGVIRINAKSVRLRSGYDGKEWTQRFETQAEKDNKHWSVCPQPEVVGA